MTLYSYHSPLIAMLLCSVQAFIGFMLLSEMPSYLTLQLHFNIESAGLLCIAPYLGLFITTISFGRIFDHLETHYEWKTRTVRQVAQFMAFIGSGTALLLCGFMDSRYASYAFLIIGQVR